jgi:single-strand DNA-binding protein
MNTVSLIGRLTSDPTARTDAEHPSAAFRLAVPRNGSDTADFVDIVTFDALAKTVADHLTKGRRIAVIGRLRQSSWTTVDGSKRSKLSVVADGVIYLDAKPKAAAVASAEDEGEEPDWPARRTGRRSA